MAMVAKICAGFALFFALVAVILKSVALSVPHFVDLHFVNDTNDVADGNRLGGIGVYQSEFNSDVQDGEIGATLAREDFPPLTFEVATTDFPLLFPGQNNFVALNLPLNAALLTELDNTLAGGQPAATGIIGEEVAAVAALELDENCGQFVAETETAVQNFFDVFQDDFLPLAIGGISTLIPVETAAALAAGVNAAFAGSLTFIQLSAAGAFANEQLVAGASQQGACTGVTIEATLQLDATVRGCFTVLFTIADNGVDFSPFDYVLALLADTTACPDGNTIEQCILDSAGRFVLDDVNLQVAPSFADDNAPSVCGTIVDNLLCGTKAGFLTGLASFVATIPGEDGVRGSTAINQYVALASAFGNNSTFAEGFPDWPTLQASPNIDRAQTGDQAQAGCVVLNPLLTPLVCNSLEDYFAFLPGILEAAGNELAPTVQDIADIYALIFAQGLPLDFAPIIFKTGLIEASFNADFGFDIANADSFTNNFNDACDDDVEDFEKISQAQALAAASTVFEALSVLLIIVGIILPVQRLAYIAPFASVAGILGGVFILAALFVVQSAPIYEGVGDEGDGEFDVFFIQGYVPLLALIDAVLFFVSGFILVGTTLFACREMGEETDYNKTDEIKADAPMEDKI